MRPARRRGYHGNDARRRRVVRDVPSAVARRTICHPFENHGFLITSSPMIGERGRRRPSAVQCIIMVVVYRPRRRTAGRRRGGLASGRAGGAIHKEGGWRGRTVECVQSLRERALSPPPPRFIRFSEPAEPDEFSATGCGAVAVRWSTRHPLSTFTRIRKHYARTHPHDADVYTTTHGARALSRFISPTPPPPRDQSRERRRHRRRRRRSASNITPRRRARVNI